ncbi:MAG: hypothetical protein QXH94_05025 [Sulfolobales archaeon]
MPSIASIGRWVLAGLIFLALLQTLAFFASLDTELERQLFIESLKARWPEIVGSVAGVVVGAALMVWVVRKVGNLRKVKKKEAKTSS